MKRKLTFPQYQLHSRDFHVCTFCCLIFTKISWGSYNYLPFTDEEAKVHREKSQQGEERNLNTSLSDSTGHALCIIVRCYFVLLLRFVHRTMSHHYHVHLSILTSLLYQDFSFSFLPFPFLSFRQPSPNFCFIFNKCLS